MNKINCWCNAGATAKKYMDFMDTIDIITTIYGGMWTLYHHIYGMDKTFEIFESVGSQFESGRGRHIWGVRGCQTVHMGVNYVQ